ncbi:MAG: aminoglycoside 6-adenylyltransferase [Defluviitaleaceae bacterium]|nr:aminoglycoside 6-adenylyltransferase [Defluviitaleaceae bacterium]
MRTEKEIFDLIINTAKNDERIRAVYMNGSRTNPNVPKDKYQDFDIVFTVTETIQFVEDKDWILCFGNPLIVQEPDFIDNATKGFGDTEHDFSRRYCWLMLFDDGNRIDLRIEIKEETEKYFLDDKLTLVLLDKDNCLPKIPSPTDEDYHIKKPTKNEYIACCNEFWWCLNNVAKGIARDELPYAMNMYNTIVRNMHDKMIEWYIGFGHGFSVSAGKSGKYFKNYLSDEMYIAYKKTYSNSEYDNFWNAIFTACELFRKTALNVAEYLNIPYNQAEENGMIKYLNNVKNDCL